MVETPAMQTREAIRVTVQEPALPRCTNDRATEATADTSPLRVVEISPTRSLRSSSPFVSLVLTQEFVEIVSRHQLSIQHSSGRHQGADLEALRQRLKRFGRLGHARPAAIKLVSRNQYFRRNLVTKSFNIVVVRLESPPS